MLTIVAGFAGMILLAFIVAYVFGMTGWAVWFLWSIIPLLIGAVGKPVSGLPVGSCIVAGLTFVVSVAGTIAQVRWADTAQ